MPVGDSKFWLIGRDLTGQNTTEPTFGLIDESSKLNLNNANTNVLSYLPNMTADFAQAIMDWRGTNGTVSLDYASLGYLPKNAPFESVDELRLVYGATVDLLAGDDLNRNGVPRCKRKDTTGTGQLNSGLFEYTTVWTREPNFHADGSSLTRQKLSNRLYHVNSRGGACLQYAQQHSATPILTYDISLRRKTVANIGNVTQIDD